ncbi:MAG: peptidoglycan DD-metalloendopeptidase family protein [Scrofimicrobium sp.]
MTKPRKAKSASASARRRIAVVGVGLVTFLMAITGLVATAPAFAESRSDVVREREESEKKIATLKGEAEGIDADLTDMAIAIEQSKIDVLDLQVQLSTAEQELADAERKHSQLVDQLVDAQTLKTEIDESIKVSEQQEGELQSAVGKMAREMYRGESVSPFQVAVSTDDLGDISSQAAAASALGRVQSKAMDEVRTGLVVSANQAEKQKAVTERITDLEAKAEQAAIDAATARDNVATNLGAVQTKLAEQETLQAQWEARRGEVATAMTTAQTERTGAIARIAAIDKAAAEEAARQEAARQEAARRAAEEAAQNNSGSGSSGSSGGYTPPPSGGAGAGMFVNPLRTSTYITSYFGMRWHPVVGIYVLHDGTDFSAACGTPQYAARSGTVVDVGYDGANGLGYYVTINHGVVDGSSYITQQMHFGSWPPVSVGQSVGTSTVVGYTGTTGFSTGCHMHLSLYLNGTATSILPYL